MNPTSEIISIVQGRLDAFICAAHEDDDQTIKQVYVAEFSKSSASHVDFVDLYFDWNIEEAWQQHIARPSNKRLTESDRWNSEHWVWYEDCPHNHHKATKLFCGDVDDFPMSRDHEMELKFAEAQPGDKFLLHVAFVDLIVTPTVSYFRKHPLVIAGGISDIPILFSVPGCPNYGEEFAKIWRTWNPNGLPR